VGAINISLRDIRDPLGDWTFPVCGYSDAIPRVGEAVCYLADLPDRSPKTEPPQQARVTGTVNKVQTEYRYTRGQDDTSTLSIYVTVYLDDYEAAVLHSNPDV